MLELKQGSYVRGESADEGKTFPKFFIEARQNIARSADEGRPIFDDIEMVEIHFAGNNLTIPVKEVTDEHRQRWPTAYRAFKDQGKFVVDGTPLAQYPGFTPARIAEFNANGVWTLENLAAIDDNGIQRLGMGARELREKVRAFIETARGNAPIDKLVSDNLAKEERINALTKQVGDLTDAIKRLESESASRKTKTAA